MNSITVKFHSKGPSRKGNPPLRDTIFCPTISILIYFYIVSKGFSVHGKNYGSPLKSLRLKVYCTFILTLKQNKETAVPHCFFTQHAYERMSHFVHLWVGWSMVSWLVGQSVGKIVSWSIHCLVKFPKINKIQ